MGKNAQKILDAKATKLLKETEEYVDYDNKKTYIIAWINFFILLKLMYEYIEDNPNELITQEVESAEDTDPEDLLEIVILAFYKYGELIQTMSHIYDFEEEWNISSGELGGMSIKELEEFKEKIDLSTLFRTHF